LSTIGVGLQVVDPFVDTVEANFTVLPAITVLLSVPLFQSLAVDQVLVSVGVAAKLATISYTPHPAKITIKMRAA
jgi:hypothetical protein